MKAVACHAALIVSIVLVSNAMRLKRKTTSDGNSNISRLGTGDPRFSQIVKRDGIVYIAGQVSRDGDTVESQTAAVLKKTDDLLRQAGTSKARLLTATIWLKDAKRDVGAMNNIWNAWLDPESKPVRAAIQAAFASPDLLVEIQVTAAIDDHSEITRLATDDPRFSGIVKHNGIVYLAGQVSSKGDTVESQTAEVLKKTDALLKQAGTSKARLLTATVWLKDAQRDVGAMNNVWNAWLDPQSKPVRAAVEAAFASPKLLVEIQVTAAVDDHSEITRLATDDPRFSGIVRHNGIVYLAGQVSSKGDTVESQTAAVLKKTDQLLQQAGSSKSQLLTAKVWLKDSQKDVTSMNHVWSSWLDPENKPVRAAVEAGFASPALLVEIQVTAASQ